ncbi:MAG TPA: hypothetical protein VKD69_02640, partial [Vicinamibacterales bacterium]|nr:hypothetical protein [Vicinamibacterales bacterium]
MIVPAIAFLGVLFIASAAFAVCPAAPVVTTTADSGAGSLRQAIADACATDSITFDLGVSPQSIVVTTGELAIDKDLTIAGPGATLLTVDGNNASRVFHVLPNRTVTISDLTIANGMMNGDPSLLQIIGAGIFNEGTLTVARVTLRNNSAPDALQGAGGAIYSRAAFSDASLTIVDSTLSDNTAGISGGAVESGAIGGRTASLTIANSTFSGNSAGDSGCVNVEQAGGVAVATITNATITGNHATFPGLRAGGLRVGSGTTVVVRNSIIAGNVIDSTPVATAADVAGTLDP